jgi:hypothetical protein
MPAFQGFTLHPQTARTEVGRKKTKREAEKLAAWMRKGGWSTALEKQGNEWVVYTTGTTNRRRE